MSKFVREAARPPFASLMMSMFMSTAAPMDVPCTGRQRRKADFTSVTVVPLAYDMASCAEVTSWRQPGPRVRTNGDEF